MTPTNVEIVKQFVDALNHNDFDRIQELCSPDCIAHGMPFVGVGIVADTSDGQHTIVRAVVPGAPASGILQAGDEILRVSGPEATWDGFEALKNGLWGWGIPGTPLTITVRRDGQPLELHLHRGRVDAFDRKLSEFIDAWRHDKLTTWPDLQIDIKLIFEKDDLVAFFAIDEGVNQDYRFAAIWSECNIFRVRDGRIVDTWNVEDSLSQMKQLGYQLTEPQKEAMS